MDGLTCQLMRIYDYGTRATTEPPAVLLRHSQGCAGPLEKGSRLFQHLRNPINGYRSNMSENTRQLREPTVDDLRVKLCYICLEIGTL